MREVMIGVVVVTICKEKSHEIVKEEFQKVKENLEWESEMRKVLLKWMRSSLEPTCSL